MKEYKYTIDGNKYEVAINEVGETTAKVTVNGAEYTVEWEKPVEEKPVVKVQPVAAKPAAPAFYQSELETLRGPVRGEGFWLLGSFLCFLPPLGRAYPPAASWHSMDRSHVLSFHRPPLPGENSHSDLGTDRCYPPSAGTWNSLDAEHTSVCLAFRILTIYFREGQ